MGCVFGKEISSSSGPVSSEIVVEKKVSRDSGSVHIHSGRGGEVVANSGDVGAGGGEGGDGGEVVQNGGDQKKEKDGKARARGERRRSKPNPRLSNPTKNIHGEQVAAGWPAWLSAVAGEAINGWIPRRADTFEKIDKIGQGTYSNVYKARDTMTGKVVALKKVRFDNLEPESVKFMAREILILRRLDHPNVVKLEGLVTSRMSCSLYLVFEYMEHDLAGLAASPTITFTEPQVKCYMNQLLSGLEHCHNRHVLHRDIKGSNLLLDNEGGLKIADFGLASFFDPNHKQPMTSRVVTLWYRPPELLLGATDYGVGVDLWSAGCILAELLAGKPIMPGRTEVEQLHKIFKLCGSPSEEYWKKSKLPHATIFKPQQSYRRCIKETFKDFPPSAFPTINTLLAIDPAERLTATAALRSEFFITKPYACDPSSLPKYPPSKEMDAKLRDEEARRLRAAGKSNADGVKKTRTRERSARAIPAPEANAELQTNLDRRRLITHANAKSKSEKFPPPHQDGTLGYPLDSSQHFDPPDVTYSSNFSHGKAPIQTWSGPLGEPASAGGPLRKKHSDSTSKSSRHRTSGRSKEK
uniref:probable serine/threonine-protein kinase At1g54610 n=1 Tax=Erigeron canadensis TaxID=72917 RepID=UPI001CB8C218|nr:probable serine/threonine-protein kinase At1g54610 [Erigeron canadensis]